MIFTVGRTNAPLMKLKSASEVIQTLNEILEEGDRKWIPSEEQINKVPVTGRWSFAGDWWIEGRFDWADLYEKHKAICYDHGNMPMSEKEYLRDCFEEILFDLAEGRPVTYETVLYFLWGHYATLGY